MSLEATGIIALALGGALAAKRSAETGQKVSLPTA